MILPTLVHLYHFTNVRSAPGRGGLRLSVFCGGSVAEVVPFGNEIAAYRRNPSKRTKPKARHEANKS